MNIQVEPPLTDEQIAVIRSIKGKAPHCFEAEAWVLCANSTNIEIGSYCGACREDLIARIEGFLGERKYVLVVSRGL
ncbi:MAG: hypothetical protein WC122_01190 [archaeon]